MLCVVVALGVLFLENALAFSAAKNHMYSVVHERAEVPFVKSPFAHLTSKVYNFNRTTKALNSSFQITRPLPPDCFFDVSVERFLSNEYRRTGVQFTMKLCDAFNEKMFGLRQLFRDCANPQIMCPLKTNVSYQMTNWIPDPTTFPPLTWYGRYKIIVKFIYENKPVGILHWYIELLEKIKF